MRVASLTCSNTEIVCALGLSHQLVGVDDHSDHPVAALEGLTRLGPDLTIDLDRLAELKPDLTLASLTVPGHEKVVEGIQQLGLDHIAPDPRCIDDIYRDIRQIADLLAVPSRGEALIDWMKKGLEPRRAGSIRSRCWSNGGRNLFTFRRVIPGSTRCWSWLAGSIRGHSRKGTAGKSPRKK